MNAPRTDFFNLDAAPLSVRDVTLVVRDLDRMVIFYTQALGLRVHEDQGSRVSLGAGKPFLHLEHLPDAAMSDPRAPGLFHTAFLMPSRADLASWLDHAVHNNVRLLGASDHNVSEAIYLNDPEGNGIEVYADRPMGRWHNRQGNLVMPSDPLDLTQLTASTPWKSAPEELRIGHVHLQTTDIPSAETFWTKVGLDVMARYPGGSFFGSGGYHHQIAANTWRSHGKQPEAGPKTGLSHLSLTASPESAQSTQTVMAPSGVGVSITPNSGDL